MGEGYHTTSVAWPPDRTAEAAVTRNRGEVSMDASGASLAGRAALVTGAGVGIGRAIAEALAGAGAFVGLHCHRSLAGAQKTLAEIRERGGEGSILQADLTDTKQAAALVAQFVAEAGRLD